MTREEKIKKIREQILPRYTRSGVYFEKLIEDLGGNATDAMCNMLIEAYNAGIDGCANAIGKTQDYFSDVYILE